MKIIFLNVWGGTRESELTNFIKEETKDTDIFCFQEATEEMRQRCHAVLQGYKEISEYKLINENDSFSQSIFIKENLELLSSGTLLSQEKESGLAIYAEIKTETGSLYVCNVHGIAHPGDKLDNPGRLIQSQEIIAFFKDKSAPVVIGGDFNVELHTKSVGIFQDHDYQDLIKQFDIDTTRNHFAWDRYPDNKQYYSDYLFLNDKVTYKKFLVPKNEVSDHLPLILEI
ncbi:MAG TPA: endonuclease/exonuclease/phosphatase family protein [Candidatus Saccharimonadales bacterium]|nr:endonuclease/exonuclease/phosphatase family protein [Candidatus Saccharimonadales bacterium]